MKKSLLIVSLCFVGFSFYGQYKFTQPDFFRKQRELPLIDMVTSVNVNVSDFGGIPDDGKNDRQAIMKALNFCKKVALTGANIKLIFKKGTYDLFSAETDKKSHMIMLNGANNILIEGNGAEIIIHNPSKGFFSIFKSKNIIVKDLFIDYDPLPFTQGKIVNVDLKERFFDLKIDAGFPQLSHEMFQKANRVWGMVMDANIPGKLKDGAPNLYGIKKFEEISSGVFRLRTKRILLLNHLAVGDPYVHIARTNGRTIFNTAGSKNITYLNITSYSSPAGSYAANSMEEWNVIGCQVKLKTGRIHSANADCFHINGGTFGPWIENSLFEGYSDDAINMKATRAPILEQKSSTELVVKQGVRKGDIIKIFNPREGILIGEFEVIENKFLGDRKMHITLKTPIEQTLDVGGTKLNDIAYVDTQSNESFVIRNNTFRNARRYGILLQNSYGIIERNVFENLSQSAISAYNGADWGEGFVAHHIKINQNIFNNCGYDATYLKEYNAATIRLNVNKLKNLEAKGKWNGVEATEWQGLEDFTITNNTFLYNKHALSIECSVNTIIKSNKFIRNSKDLSKKGEIIFKNNNSNLVFEE
ncbi:right-handed parallel beta-helix repeat-containing protein [uncultured Polaribacter sp.]|uniref:right-handed parallel beta-helix repeat-containing protein n=1 Tax=uncultured Polaribacter sp. TaxID=174711 RepID=UPI00260C4E3C|nr:right-handed parallel beta-helix repeat-containing protein [uncultured Polaribacter sp.]